MKGLISLVNGAHLLKISKDIHLTQVKQLVYKITNDTAYFRSNILDR